MPTAGKVQRTSLGKGNGSSCKGSGSSFSSSNLWHGMKIIWKGYKIFEAKLQTCLKRINEHNQMTGALYQYSQSELAEVQQSNYLVTTK